MDPANSAVKYDAFVVFRYKWRCNASIRSDMLIKFDRYKLTCVGFTRPEGARSRSPLRLARWVTGSRAFSFTRASLHLSCAA